MAYGENKGADLGLCFRDGETRFSHIDDYLY